MFVVAAGGFEPPTVYLPQELQTWLLYQLSYTTPINMYYPKFRPYAEPNPAYDSWLFAQRAYSEPSLHLFALLKFRIPAAHSAYILSHTSLGLALLPSRLILCMSGPTRGRCGVRNLPCRLWLYLRVRIPSLSTPSACRSLSMPFRLCATYRLAPWLLALISDLNKCCCLLAGFARCTTLGVRGGCGIRTTRTQSGTDLQSAAFDRSAKPPNYVCLS